MAGSSDSIFSRNPGCVWMRGRNSLFSAVLNSFTLAGLMVQLMMRENMVRLLSWMVLQRDFCHAQRTSLKARRQQRNIVSVSAQQLGTGSFELVRQTLLWEGWIVNEIAGWVRATILPGKNSLYFLIRLVWLATHCHL